MKKPLTVKEIEALGPGEYREGTIRGLYLRKRGDKVQFLMEWKSEGKKFKKFYPVGTSLKEARGLAQQDRLLIDNGINPKQAAIDKKEAEEAAEKAKEEKRKLAENTFNKVADDWLHEQTQINRWKNDHGGQIRAIQRINTYLKPAIGSKPITQITVNDAANTLKPIWISKQGTADKVYSLARIIFNWAIAKGLYKVNINPFDARGPLGELLKPLTKQRNGAENRPALDFHEIPEFMKELLALNSTSSMAVAFSILTASRFKAVRLAEWTEIDLKNRIWTIPERNDKVKGKRLRQIFLSQEAIELLNSLPKTSKYIFASREYGHHLSDAAPSQLIRGMDSRKAEIDGRGWRDFSQIGENGEPPLITQHGTARATFKTWTKDDQTGNNRKFDQEAVELCLLHARKDIYKGAYDRSQLTQERRAVIDAWGRFCFSGIKRPTNKPKKGAAKNS